MNEVMLNKQPIIITDQSLERREDIYAIIEYGKIVSRYSLNDQIYSADFWEYLKDKFNISAENITKFCDIHSDTKNRTEKVFKYIIKTKKPYKVMFMFYDEEKVIDNKIYENEEEQKNKITDLTIYYDFDVAKNADDLITDLNNIFANY